MRCLVVDDNVHDRELVERMLKAWGYRATCVPNGAAALQAVSAEPFDLVIVDMGMPGMSGPDVLRALRRTRASLRLLVVSGFDDRRHILEAIDAGADGYLVKDELVERLGYALQEVIAGRSPLSSRAGAVLLRYFASLRQSVAEAPRAPVDPDPPALRSSPVGSTPLDPTAFEPGPPKVDASGEIDLGKVDLRRD